MVIPRPASGCPMVGLDATQQLTQTGQNRHPTYPPLGPCSFLVVEKVTVSILSQGRLLMPDTSNHGRVHRIIFIHTHIWRGRNMAATIFSHDGFCDHSFSLLVNMRLVLCFGTERWFILRTSPAQEDQNVMHHMCLTEERTNLAASTRWCLCQCTISSTQRVPKMLQLHHVPSGECSEETHSYCHGLGTSQSRKWCIHSTSADPIRPDELLQGGSWRSTTSAACTLPAIGHGESSTMRECGIQCPLLNRILRC